MPFIDEFVLLLHVCFCLASESGFGDMIPEAEGLLDVSEYATSLHDVIEKVFSPTKTVTTSLEVDQNFDKERIWFPNMC